MQTSKKGILSQIDASADMIINALSVYMAFFFACLIDREPPVFPTTPTTVIGILVTVILSALIYQHTGAYQSYTVIKARYSYSGFIKGNILLFVISMIIITVGAHDGELVFYTIWNLLVVTLSSVFLITKRKFILAIAKILHKNSFMLKRTIVVGDNTASAKEYIHEIAVNPGSGVMILGYVGDKIDPDVGCDKLGSFKDLEKILDRYRPTDVVFAIDAYDKRHLIKLVNLCDDRCIKVYFLPVIYGFFKNTKQIEQIGSIPLINVHTNPLSERINAAIKRTVDIIGSLALILLTSPLMLLAVIGIKLTSDGPILFKQQRVGMMGKPFTMLKFRSMPVNRDAENNWTTEGDARPTKFGSFIRRTAIDELPQFFNVLAGSMSLVGPRPEIPKFVDRFREEIPLYMVKHYVKPGVTGLSQIKGLRGDTSVEERILTDISYIENWSLWLDITILLKTPFKAFNKYERYVNKTESDTSGIIGAIAEKFKKEEEANEERKPCQKILYAASTTSHIKSFHMPYIKALRDDGHTVYTMANGKGADFDIPFEKKFFSKKNKECRGKIREILDKEHFDLIILNTSLAAFHVRLAARRKGRPRIVNIVHGFLFSEHQRGLRANGKALILLLAEKLLRGKTDAILTMNDEDHRIATRQNLVHGPIIPTFGMGVPDQHFNMKPGEIRKKYAKDSDFVLLFAGELSARKNQKFLIKAMPDLLLKIPEAKLWLLGDGDELPALKQQAEKLGVSERIVFIGRKKNAADYMRDCDLYVSASLVEGLPFNIVEALGVGKPVLASRIKGHTDILHHAAGVLFDPHNKKEFVEKAVLIKEGKITLSEKRIHYAYRNFSAATVFADTYEKLKEASRL